MSVATRECCGNLGHVVLTEAKEAEKPTVRAPYKKRNL